jgi:hypothetical protein
MTVNANGDYDPASKVSTISRLQFYQSFDKAGSSVVKNEMEESDIYLRGKKSQSRLNPFWNPFNFNYAWAGGWGTPADLNFQVLAWPYMGKDGLLTSFFSTSWSADMRVLDIDVAFPGQPSYCGGYFSPLMLFFDSQRPTFKNMTKFETSPNIKVTHWPEAHAPGYFLVLDRNGDGLINNWTELFGSSEDFANGFETLKNEVAFDKMTIVPSDLIYSKLKLWNDKNGDGISQTNELFLLKDRGLMEISLAYDNNAHFAFGDRAIFKEKSKFIFKNRQSEIHSGEIIDVWLAGEK